MYTFPFNFFRYSKTATIGTIILVLCLLPSSGFSNLHVQITYADAIIHFFMFFIFSAALYMDITRNRKLGLLKWPVFLIVFTISLMLASLTEVLQYIIVPLNRTGSFSDLGCDLLGTLAGIGLLMVIKRKSRPES